MSTPAHVVASSVIKLMVISLGVFWFVSFAMSRFFVFYEAYTDYLALLRDESWLRVQCAHPEFYSNMRQHTELCDRVRLNSERSPVLIALNAVAQTAHLCGRQSCTEVRLHFFSFLLHSNARSAGAVKPFMASRGRRCRCWSFGPIAVRENHTRSHEARPAVGLWRASSLQVPVAESSANQPVISLGAYRSSSHRLPHLICFPGVQMEYVSRASSMQYETRDWRQSRSEVKNKKFMNPPLCPHLARTGSPAARYRSWVRTRWPSTRR